MVFKSKKVISATKIWLMKCTLDPYATLMDIDGNTLKFDFCSFSCVCIEQPENIDLISMEKFEPASPEPWPEKSM